MELSIDEVRRIARLAKLELQPDEIPVLREQLVTILEYVDRLNELDTATLEPDAATPTVEEALREDRHRTGLDPESATANAPDTGADHFRVPRILG